MYKAKVRKTAPRTEPPAPRAASNEGRVSAPNSAKLRADAASDPALAEKMQSRMSANFPGIDLLSRGSGRPLELPDDLRGRLEAHFGASLDNIRFRESSDAADLGAKAYARGDEIHFAPGQFRPDTEQGRKMIGHEVSHIRRQASGGMGNGVLLNNSLEHQADLDGAAIASGDVAPLQSVTAFAPMPVASFDAAPAQGWGLPEHGILTELARKKAAAYAAKRAQDAPTANPQDRQNVEAYRQMAAANNGQGEFDSERAKKSLAYGAKFNDVGHHSTAGFALNYMDHKSAFINQSHHGDMQFLHSMDTSGGDTVENMAKARRYARFASDVYQNKENMQGRNMLGYVLNDTGATDAEDSDVGRTNGKGNPTRFQEMMLSTMLSAGKLKEIEAQVAAEGLSAGAAKQRRMALIKQAAQNGQSVMDAARKKYRNKSGFKKWRAGSEQEYVRKKARAAGLSKYAIGSVGDFFTGGDKELDAGMVALGSASHMIEDSYAGAHASRGENLYLGDGGKKATDLSETGAEISAKSTDVITTGDYNQQNANPLWGRHPKGDEFAETASKDQDEIVDNSRGGALARDAAAQFIMMNAREKHGGTGGANDFLKGVLKADVTAQSYPGGPTRTGSAYAKKVGGANNKENAAADAFYASTESRAHNTHADASERAATYKTQMGQLETLRASSNPETREHYRQQSNEMLANMNSMIAQLRKAREAGALSGKDAEALQDLTRRRDRLARQLSVYVPN